MKIYIVMEIGCLECGENSRVVGVFKTHKKAEEVAQLNVPSYKHSGKIDTLIFEYDLEW